MLIVRVKMKKLKNIYNKNNILEFKYAINFLWYL